IGSTPVNREHGESMNLLGKEPPLSAAGAENSRVRTVPSEPSRLSGSGVAAWVFPIAVSALAWTIICAAVPPSQQEFPLGDDWAFARGAFAFARGEGCHYYGWWLMPLWGMWLCAWPFVRAFGESHVALRLCTLILALAGLVSFNDLLTQ